MTTMTEIHNLLQAALCFSREMTKGTDPMVVARHYLKSVASCPDFADLVESEFRTEGRDTALRTLINKAMEMSR